MADPLTVTDREAHRRLRMVLLDEPVHLNLGVHGR